nr:protein sieve element occlusion b [Quercus suber]
MGSNTLKELKTIFEDLVQKVPRSRGDRHFFFSSDDNAMMKQIQATHAPDGREVDVKPLVHIIDDIFKRAGFGIPGFIQISCECSGGGDAHATTVAIFNVLTSYSWDAKLVLALAAFAVNYGEFWLVVQLYPTNPLAKSVAFLKQMPEILERAESLKPKFEAFNNLIKAMLDVTKCIVEFKELPSQYITPDTPEMVAATAHIPTAVHWTIRSIVACASQIMGLIGMGHEYIATIIEAWELSSLAHKASIEVLRRKIVLLFITDLEIPYEELSILEQMYTESRHQQSRPESQYEVVWIPVVDKSTPWNADKQKQFDNLQGVMPWYSVFHPSLLEPAGIRHIKEAWKFTKKPLLVVLDLLGKPVNENSVHMMWIWGSVAYPFTWSREKTLWQEES